MAIVSFYNAIKTMRKLLSYLYLIFLAIMLVWLVVKHPPPILMVVAFVCVILGAIAIGFVCIWLQDTWSNFWYHQRLQRLLGDMTLEEVLDQSPYQYGHVFQGDDGYRIWHKSAIYDFVQSGVSKKAAQMWIVEQFFSSSQ